jgi:hypothetical protein
MRARLAVDKTHHLIEIKGREDIDVSRRHEL